MTKILKPMIRINSRITPEQKKLVVGYAKKSKLTEGDVIRLAISKFFDKN